MNDYEIKQEQRRARLARGIARLKEEGNRHLETAREKANSIPFGQPILVGHHSEKRHRRDLERIEANHREGHQKLELADKLERRLNNMGRAVSSDDPEAVQKLKAELENFHAYQAEMKKANLYFKKKGSLEGYVGPEYVIKKATSYLRFGGHGRPFPPFALSNLAANIRRIKKRIEYLGHLAGLVVREPIVGEGFRIEEDKDDKRILLTFNKRLSKTNYFFVRREGWLWSPTRKAFVRNLNHFGRNAADLMARKAPELLKPEDGGASG